MGNQKERRVFNSTFKENAVRRVTEQGMKLSNVASELGIHPNMLSRWKHEHIFNSENHSLNSSEHQEAEKEIIRLQQEVMTLRREKEILKEALIILSHEKK